MKTKIQNIDSSSLSYPDTCSYCGLQDSLAVVQCLECQKWFCNGKTYGQSHIIHHLVKSRHKKVLHKDILSKGTVLECSQCGCENVFLLGSVLAQNADVLLCRQPCHSGKIIQNEDWNESNWKSIISDGKFVSWLMKIPSKKQMTLCHRITNVEMNKFEDLWRKNTIETTKISEKSNVDEELNGVLLRYKDACEYASIYAPLLKLDYIYNKKISELQVFRNVIVRWVVKTKNICFAFFNLPKLDDELTWSMGNKLRLTYPSENESKGKEWFGSIVKLPDGTSEEYGIEIVLDVHVPTKTKKGFLVELDYNNSAYTRMKRSLKKFAHDENVMSTFIYHKLLGHDIEEEQFKVELPENYSAPGLPILNQSQVYAVKTVLQRPLSLIQGPPGTGKTVTSASIVYHLVRQMTGRCLVCAPSNTAVDHLTEKIHKTGLNVVRLVALSRESAVTPVSFLALHNQVRNMPGQVELKKLQRLKDLGELNECDRDLYNELLVKCEQHLLQAADVICCTCIGAGDFRLKLFEFARVLIDETTQSTELECLIPLVKGVKQLILVGDHRQLGPVVVCRKAANAGLNQSMFERLAVLDVRSIMLEVQYRMHPMLSKFSNDTFYMGSLKNGVTEAERILPGVKLDWPDASKPTYFWSTVGAEEIGASGISWLNRQEAINVERLVSMFRERGVEPGQIGVITPYKSQRAYIIQYMKHQGSSPAQFYAGVEVASVDAFQGREKDIILFSCVRSNVGNDVGFLKDTRRLNVALTRAKYGLVIIGNPKMLCHDPLWHNLVFFYKQNQLLVEGPLHALKRSSMKISKPAELTNASNPGGHFISTVTYDAKNAIIRGGTFDRTAKYLPSQQDNLTNLYIPRPFNANVDNDDHIDYIDARGDSITSSKNAFSDDGLAGAIDSYYGPGGPLKSSVACESANTLNTIHCNESLFMSKLLQQKDGMYSQSGPEQMFAFQPFFSCGIPFEKNNLN